MMYSWLRAMPLGMALLAFPVSATEPLQGGEVVAGRGGVELSVAEIDAKVRSMPPELRSGYLADPELAARLIDGMLIAKQVAALARSEGLHEDPEHVADLALMEVEMLSGRHLRRKMDALAIPDFEPLARERYLADPEAFRPAAHVDLRHVLIPTDGRDDAEAKAVAQAIYDRTTGGEDFAAVIEEFAQREGQGLSSSVLSRPDASRMETAFASAVLSLQQVGDMAGPVRSRFGYHVIRLERYETLPIPPFEEVKNGQIKSMRERFLTDERTRYLGDLSKQETSLNNEVIQGLPARYAALHGAPTANEE